MSFEPPGDCPVCGDAVPARARVCPHCGADEKSGWNDDTYLDGIELPPDDAAEPEREASRISEREFGSGRPRGAKAWMTAALLVVLLVALLWRWVWI